MTLLMYSSMRVGNSAAPDGQGYGIPAGYGAPEGFVVAGATLPKYWSVYGAHPVAAPTETSFGVCLELSSSGDYPSNGVQCTTPLSSKIFAGVNYNFTNEGGSMSLYWGTLMALRNNTSVIIGVAPTSVAPTASLGVWVNRTPSRGVTPDYTISNVFGSWRYLEIGYDSATGLAEIHIDGSTVLAFSTGLTAQVNNVMLGSGAPPNTTSYQGWKHRYDNFYVCDGLGAENNTYLGPIVVREFNPIALTADAGWVAADGVSPPTLAMLTDASDATLARAITDDAQLSLQFDADVGTSNILAAGMTIRHSDSGDGVLQMSSQHGSNTATLGTVSGGHSDIRGKTVFSTVGPNGPWSNSDLDILTVKTVADLP